MNQAINSYYIYSLQCDPENIFKDEFEDFFVKCKTLKYASDYKAFFIENFPNIMNQASQIKEFKKSNKRVECIRSDGYLKLIAYQGDDVLEKMVLKESILAIE